MRLDDDHLERVFADLDAAGVKYTDQHDARLHWLEHKLVHLAGHVAVLEGRLLAIEGELRPHRADTEAGALPAAPGQRYTAD